MLLPRRSMCRCHDIILTDAGVVGAGEPCITLDTVARLQLSFSCSSWRREQPMKIRGLVYANWPSACGLLASEGRMSRLWITSEATSLSGTPLTFDVAGSESKLCSGI